jgi:predicted ribosomally synthesized peptide with nif11-like leader
MSLENVKLFYARLAIDEAFRIRVQSAQTKEECTQAVKDEGFDFTSQELEDYTAQMLNPSDEVTDLNEAELEAVIGGFNALTEFSNLRIQPLYGVIWPPRPPVIQPLYGVVLPRE